MRSIKFILLLFVIISINSCSNEENQTQISDAILMWQGDYEFNGCGFLVTINNHEYKPENEEIIDIEYKISIPVHVEIEYIYLNQTKEYFCGENPQPYRSETIRIISIKKR